VRRRAVEGDSDSTAVPVIPRSVRVRRLIREIDFFPKVDEDTETVQTSFGGVVSVLTGLVMLWLFVGEMSDYMYPPTKHHLEVDTHSLDKMSIAYNITFPSLQCSVLHLDVEDKFGEMILHSDEQLFKQPLNEAGQPLGELLEGDVAAVGYSQNHGQGRGAVGVGCTTWGSIHVSRVAGNLHWALGASARRSGTTHTHTFRNSEVMHFNASHVIHELAFGKHTQVLNEPLSDHRGMSENHKSHWVYSVNVVPIKLPATQAAADDELYEYSVHSRELPYVGARLTEHNIPGLFIKYELSPFLVRIESAGRSFKHFLVQVCAILGGVLTMTGLLDALWYRVSMHLKLSRR
jgi:hypothetical protein